MSDREELPRFIAPMLLRSCALPAAPDSRWVLEVKWDGIRAQVRVDRGRLTLRTRPGRNAASEFPELGELGERLCARRVVFDAELVWPGCDGHLDFGAIAARLGRRRRVVALSFDRRSTCCSPVLLSCLVASRASGSVCPGRDRGAPLVPAG